MGDIRSEPCGRTASHPGDSASEFAHPLTRMVLAGTGSTTRLLEDGLATTLSIQVLGQRLTTAALVSRDIRGVLAVMETDEVLVRRSSLVTADLVPVSRNYVVGRDPRAPDAGRVMTSTVTPIGYGLAALGPSRRQMIAVTRSLWLKNDGTTVACAVKNYVIFVKGAPLLYLSEHFNPDFLPT